MWLCCAVGGCDWEQGIAGKFKASINERGAFALKKQVFRWWPLFGDIKGIKHELNVMWMIYRPLADSAHRKSAERQAVFHVIQCVYSMDLPKFSCHLCEYKKFKLCKFWNLIIDRRIFTVFNFKNNEFLLKVLRTVSLSCCTAAIKLTHGSRCG